ncbi:MAG: bifunctional glutamate N-acetyltransferase/amino-acid acetyltransferase ArgJ [Planctomycetaceae bacterium]|jgi:glutamate N-acetyltransferase/amino-acid N-acetyltransferase|nr:bifunctional glutamate N-acetyltransferase/amino-acid acetyltransferase ArgJ [Planctomycetaceae bacterium]
MKLPYGYRFSGVFSGMKRDKTRRDLSLIVSDFPAVAAGVYTTNLVYGAPVHVNRAQTPGTGFRLVVVNSGVANACTGDQGIRDAEKMIRLALRAVGASEEEKGLVMSTGVIGEFLPMEKIAAGITDAAKSLRTEESAFLDAAKGMMTTDTVHKVSYREIRLDSGQTVRLAGMCKGAAMIGPNMATMLAVLFTDAAVLPETAKTLLRDSVEDTFNCISVEGHMSTSDTVLLLANGAAVAEPVMPGSKDFERFSEALHEVCLELARAIPADGEGATHLITIHVKGCDSRDSAKTIAKTIAESALVKTAVAGADPNWGRIVSAAGYAGVALDADQIGLSVNGYELYRDGMPRKFDAATVSASIRDNHDTDIELTVGEGDGAIRFWTTDLTAEYVRLNADYHT